jgi:hypothetical protein
VFGVLTMNADARWVREKGAHCDARGDCDTLQSIAKIQQIEGDRSRLGAVSTAGFVVGGAALAGALVVWLTAPKAAPVPGAGLRFAPTPGGGGATIAASF